MYKPPENSNRVKSIKSKFENNDENITKTKPIFRKSKTLLDLKSNGNGKVNSPRSTTPELLSPVKNTKSPKEPSPRVAQSSLSRQLSDPSKCNIKRTPAFRLDRNVQGAEKSTRFLQNRTRYQDTHSHVKDLPAKVEKVKPRAEPEKYNFSNLRDKFNNKPDESPKINIPTCDIENKTDTNISTTNALKFLYAEPLPKSQRSKQISEDLPSTIHNSATLRLSDIIQTDKPRKKPKSDDESSSPSNNRSFSKHDVTYGSLRCKKSLEATSPRDVDSGLTNSLKLALKKPLPHGPAPKKPPRTFVHSANSETTKNVPPTSLSLDKSFSKKLNKELKKGASNGKGVRNDPKYMLDKLESAIKSKGKLFRKPPKSSNSEEDSDNEKTKLLAAEPAYYSSPASSPKFTLGCLPSLSCASSMYQDVKVSNSSFFVDSEEPVYAEPFEFQVSLEEQLRNILGGDGVNNNNGEGVNKNGVRQSVHYASSPVSDTKFEDFKNLAGFEKSSDQVVDSTSLSSYTSDSMASTPSEENRTLINNMKVKDFVKVIEGSNKSNGLPSDTKSKDNGDLPISDNRIKKLESQLKTTLDKCFSSSSVLDEQAQQYNGNTSESEFIEEASDMGETRKFETYVKRVRSRVYCRSPKKHHLFHCCLLVALNRNIPYIKSKYPENVKEPFSIADLCFPEVENGPMDTSVEAQCYSLIITNELGDRMFGYCRRVLPEASTTCLPLAYCVLTKNRSPGFYNRILEELEFRHGYPEKFKNTFLEQLYNCKFPLPGETIAINCSKIVSNSELSDDQVLNDNETEFNSTNLSDVSVTNKLNCDTSANKINDIEDSVNNEQEVDLNSFVIVCNSGEYGTLIKHGQENNTPANNNRVPSAIYEVSSELSSPVSLKKRSNSLPSTPDELESLPSELVFNRPHDSRHEEDDLKLLIDVVKFPILQKVFSSLLLERKVILVSGMLSKLSSCINALQIILYPFSWQHTIIPVLPKSLWEIVDTPTPLLCGVLSSEVVQHYVIDNAIVVNLDTNEILLQVGDEDNILPDCLTQTLKAGLSLANTMTTTNSGTHNIFLSDAFLRVFIQCCSHYKDHIKDGNFEKPEFIQHSKYKGKHIRQFLKWFTETTMFYFFSQAAIAKSNSLDLFEQRIKIYCSESATVILNKMKGWSNYKSYLRPSRF